MNTQLVETKQNLFSEISVQSSEDLDLIDKIIAGESRYIKDLKINVGNALRNQELSAKESLLLAYAVAVNEKNTRLQDGFSQLATKEGATEAELAEIIACVSLMNVNNVFYRFRHYIKKEYYENAPAGIKMSIMMNPVLGKEFFELVSLMVSSLNGCELCVTSHEESVIKHGGSQNRIFEAIRLGAILKGLAVIL